MAIYIYQHPKKTKQVREIVQTMNEIHEYIDEEGTKWNRIFTVPQGAVSTKLDPFNSQQYIEKIGVRGGTMGDALERSAELSARRAEKRDGVDPVKEGYYKEYAKKRNGKKHPTQIKEQTAKSTWTI